MIFGNLLLIILPVVAFGVPKVKVVPAAHLVQVPDVTVYEKSVKLLFKVPMPIVPRNRQTSASKFPREVNNITELILDDMDNELFQQIPDPLSKKSRQNRVKRGDLELILGAGGGFAFGSILTRAWDKFFGNDDDVGDYVNKLRSNVVDYQQNLVLMESQLNQYSIKLAAGYDKLTSVAAAELEEITHGFLLKIQRDWYVESKFSCLMKVIPNKLVPHKTLLAELNNLDVKLSRYNKSLAIPVEDLSRYYKTPLADCMFTDTQMVVVINVPIIRSGNTWRLYEMVHTKFAYNNQTCTVYPQEANYMAQCSSKSVLITSSYLRHCDVHMHGLCLVPEYTKDSSESLSCAMGLLAQKPVNELQQYCAFRCSSNTELMVQVLDESTIVLTNAEFLEVTCPHEYRNFTFKKEGAVQLQLQCNCTMLVDRHFFIDSPIFCSVLPSNDDFILRVSPNLWSRLETAVGSNSLYFHEHTNQTLSDDWRVKMPILNLTQPKTEIINEPLFFDPSNLSYTHIWLIILSVLLVTEFWITVHVFRAYMQPTQT